MDHGFFDIILDSPIYRHTVQLDIAGCYEMLSERSYIWVMPEAVLGSTSARGRTRSQCEQLGSRATVVSPKRVTACRMTRLKDI